MSSIYQLVYVSAGQTAAEPQVLADILEASRRNNPAKDITGMLLHIDGGFLQILEGPQDAVRKTYQRILSDRRHFNQQILLERAVPERLFPDWTMGFEQPLEGHPDTGGIFEATRTAIEGAVSPEKAKEIAILLHTFYTVNMGQKAA